MSGTRSGGKRVLVTGASGFTGGRLAAELAARGYQVRGLVRSPENSARLERAGVEPRIGDVRDPEAVSRAVEGVALVFHIAAVFRSAGHPDSYYEAVNAGGVENVVDAARRHGVERLVHCSTMGVHGHVSEIPSDEDSPFNPGDVYQETKLAGERIARRAFEAGLPGVIVRPMGIYGPGDFRFLKLFRSIRNGRFVMVGSGQTLYHFVYIDDLVEGFILCGEHPAAVGGTYLIGGDHHISLNELVGLVAGAVGVSPPRWRVPVWPVMAVAGMAEAVCRPLGVEPPLHRRRVTFFTKDRAFTNAKARRELGFVPQVDMPEGIRRTARWYFEQGLLSGDSPPALRAAPTSD